MNLYVIYELTNDVKEKFNLKKHKFSYLTRNIKTNITNELSPGKIIDFHPSNQNIYKIGVHSHITNRV